MAIATFFLNKITGASPGTSTDTNNHPTFLSSDTHTENTSLFPVNIPLEVSTDPLYSYETVLQWEVDTAPNVSVSDFRVYGPNVQPDNPNGNNSSPKLTVLWGQSSSYTAPVNTASTIATVTQHDNYFGPNTGEYLPLGLQPVDNILNAQGEKTDYLYTQLKVNLGAQSGPMNPQVYTIRYTEV